LNASRIFHHTPDSGRAALAATRGRYNYVGIVQTEGHRRVIRQVVTSAIVAEISLGKKDGFQCSRKLSRAQSLGGDPPQSVFGSPSEAVMSASPAASSVAVTPQKVPETSAGAEKKPATTKADEEEKKDAALADDSDDDSSSSTNNDDDE
jgi:hypothetical protein